MTLSGAYVLAGLLGLLVGAVELLQRYRAEPFQALANWWGAAYLVFNSAVAVAAFYVAVRAANLTEDAELELIRWAAAAGFGSATLLRAKIMTVRVGDGKELALGPELVVQTFLSVIDREIDRYRARKRYATVHALFKDIDYEKAHISLPMQVFQAMQTVTEAETRALTARLAEVDAMTSLTPAGKSYQLGFYLLDLVGAEFLADVLNQYGDEFR